MSTVLVTGGAGFIGSHTTLTLLEAGYQVVVLDNLSNSSQSSLQRVSQLTAKQPIFIQGDVNDLPLLNNIFPKYNIQSVIHFAGLKAVGESVQQPLRYYQNNVQGTLTLCQAMAKHKVNKLVFSSSATVYGEPKVLPLKEDMSLGLPTNPYGQSKLMVENILRDISQAQPEFNMALLRYFNPVGAHPSGQIGEDPNGQPNNLMPYISQVAVGKREYLSVFGDDYPTEDGTGIRDYIHVMDLATGHVKALQKLEQNPGLVTYNLGTGKGYSVLEVIKAFEHASGKKVNYRICPRRDGDVIANYADTKLAQKELNWQAQYNLEQMCQHSWNWQLNNPDGYN